MKNFRKKDMQSGFWCLDCTYLQDMCKKCISCNARASTTGSNARTSAGAYTGSSPYPSQQQDQMDKLNKLKQQKQAKKQHAKNKVKSVIMKEESQEDPYDMEKVLEALGEVKLKYYQHYFYQPSIFAGNK